MKKILALLLVMLMLASSVSASPQPSPWADEEVKTAISLGLVPKDLQNNYKTPITRIEFVQLLAKLANKWSPERKLSPNSEEVKFLDTDDENILYFASLGIVEGDGEGHFMPKDLLQRQEAAKILYKTADNFTLITTEDTRNTTIHRGYSSHEMPHSFKDSSLLRSWSRDYVNWTYRKGIMEGVSDNRFAPEETYTREQAIVTSLRLYYSYGMVDKISTIPPVDYYPVYKDKQMDLASYWIDSTLTEHSVEEFGHISLDENYAFVYDNIGVGVTYGHVINKEGRKLLTDLYGSNGYFSKGLVEGYLIELHTRDEERDSDSIPLYFVIDMRDGEVYENKSLKDILLPVEDQSPCKIVSEETGSYALYSADGEKLSNTYQNALKQIDETHFLGWVSDNPKTYDILYCDGVNGARIQRTEIFRFDTEVYIENGLYAIQNTDEKITLFDSFGDTISEINSETPVILQGFANGLIVLEDATSGQLQYYTPAGKRLYMLR
ncbi:MAG TPA: S-layer homology domain-containing protein [Tissierellaceae bacterium]|nr:S-layer homology domain-containing protein [Tissierellaceae bacterium]